MELLVATAVLSVGIVVTLQAISFCGQVAGFTADMTSALFFAEDKMQEWEFKEKKSVLADLPLENLPSEAEETAGKFKWNYSFRPKDESILYDLIFKASWTRAGKQEEITFNTYLRK